MLVAFVAVEMRSTHALMPIRILADRTRGTSFAVMLIIGAAMFAMFYFLGLYIQQVLGYSPLKSGFAFLPFSAGIVVAAQIASTLMTRVDPRWIAGVGTLLAAGGMFGFAQLEVDSSYTTGLLPWITILAVGMGLVFVPMTLTATAGVAAEDSGVASAVLNTMSQVGGALGLATLSTVFANGAKDRGAELGAALQAKVASGAVSPEQLQAAQHQIALQAQTFGSSHAYLVAGAMIIVGSLITFGFLNVKHELLSPRATRTSTSPDRSSPCEGPDHAGGRGLRASPRAGWHPHGSVKRGDRGADPLLRHRVCRAEPVREQAHPQLLDHPPHLTDGRRPPLDDRQGVEQVGIRDLDAVDDLLVGRVARERGRGGGGLLEALQHGAQVAAQVRAGARARCRRRIPGR